MRTDKWSEQHDLRLYQPKKELEVFDSAALLQLSCNSNYTPSTKLPCKSLFPAQCEAEGETPGRRYTNTPPKLLWRWVSEKLSETLDYFHYEQDVRWASVTVSGCVVFGV